MATFSYKALTSSGSVTLGEIEAIDRPEAIRVLDRRGLQPVSIKELGASSAAAKKPKETKKISPVAERASGSASKTNAKVEEEEDSGGPLLLKKNDVVLFTEELSDMLSAGLQLEPALRAMENRQEIGSLKKVSRRLRESVLDGTSFSQSLKKVSPSFDALYCSLAAAGEASGALDTILKRQLHYLKTLQELRTKMVLALIYPAFLVLAGIGVVIVFVTKLIPQLTQLLEASPGAEVPMGAALMIGLSTFFKRWWLFMLLVVAGGGIFFKVWKDNDANKPAWDRMKLRLPLVGNVIASRFYVQFLETMANLVSNGLPLLRSLELSRDATQNIELRTNLDEVIDQVGDGRALSVAMMRTRAFPPVLIDIVAVGEQTGKIDQSLRRASERYDKELNKNLQKIMALVMPTILIIMATLIGVMAYLMVTAIFQTISNLGPSR